MKLTKILVFSALALLSELSVAAALRDIQMSTLPGNKVELRFQFDGPVATPRDYSIDSPARIALDFDGVNNLTGARVREFGQRNARSVSVVEAGNRMRIIVNMDNLQEYNVVHKDAYVYVTIGSGSDRGNYTSVDRQLDFGSSKVPLVSNTRMIENIDFQRGDIGEGNVIIEVNSADINPNVRETGKAIQLTFPKTSMPDELKVQLDVADFATPVKKIKSVMNGDNVIVTIEPSGFYDYLVYQTKNTLTVSVRAMTKDELDEQKKRKFAYTGEKVTLQFQHVNVRDALQILADIAEKNLVVADSVQGDLALNLIDVPWDQALDIILKNKGLDKRENGNVLMVAPASELATMEREALEAQQKIVELSPLRKDIIQINYAKASEIAALYQGQTSKENFRGSITADDRTNNLIVTLPTSEIEDLRRLVSLIDIPVRQVMIEARIVEATVGYDKALGVRWSGKYYADKAGQNLGISGLNGATIEQQEVLGNNYPINNVTHVNQGNFVDLVAGGATSGFGIGFITKHVLLDLQLSAMEKTGNGEVISQPKVVTADKKPARILRGSEIPYQEATSSGATSVAFKEAALSLDVTPQITPDNRIIMDVVISKDAPDFANSVGGVPPITKNSVTANIIVNDGETIVIGGVFQANKSESIEKVPFLGDLPIIGRLFRRNLIEDSKEELLIFLTPRILNSQDVTVR